MATLNENLQLILAHLKTKGLSIKDVSDLAFFFDVDDRERFYKWLRRVKTEKDSKPNPKYERALLCILHSFRVTGEQRLESLSTFQFQVGTCLGRFDLIEELGKDWHTSDNYALLRRLAEALRRQFLRGDGVTRLVEYLEWPGTTDGDLMERLKRRGVSAAPSESPEDQLLDAQISDRFTTGVQALVNPPPALTDLLTRLQEKDPLTMSRVRNFIKFKMQDGLSPEDAVDQYIRDKVFVPSPPPPPPATWTKQPTGLTGLAGRAKKKKPE